MALELTPVERDTIILAMNSMAHLLLPFAFYRAGSHIGNLVISYQNHIHEV